jgi:hypothetical protein
MLGLGVAGCAGSGDTMLAPRSGDNDSMLGNLLAFNSTKPPGPLKSPITQQDRPVACPQIEVQDGTASARTYVGTEQTNNNVRYQFSMGDVARECSKVGDQIMIKVGVQGRVLLGPAGAAGSFSVPVRIAVRRDADGKPAASKLYPVAATIPQGQTETDFALVADPLGVPYLRSEADQDYTILVGFDVQAKPAAPGNRKARNAAAQ